jgi:hypothetical protein
MTVTDLGGEVAERDIPGLGTLRFENYGVGEWRTQKGEPAKKSKRRYLLNGEELDSVSQIVSVLEKPALYRWYEDRGARGAVQAERMGELADVPEEEIIQRVRLLGLGADAKKDEAADRGTAMHAALHVLATTGEPPNLGDYPVEQRPWLMGATRLWMTLDAEPIESELIVCNPVLGYAGRLDLLCLTDGLRTLVDYKSGKGRLYSQAHWQARGYADCLPHCGIEPVDRILIAGVDDEGGFQVVECSKSSEDWAALVHVYRANKR